MSNSERVNVSENESVSVNVPKNESVNVSSENESVNVSSENESVSVGKNRIDGIVDESESTGVYVDVSVSEREGGRPQHGAPTGILVFIFLADGLRRAQGARGVTATCPQAPTRTNSFYFSFV